MPLVGLGYWERPEKTAERTSRCRWAWAGVKGTQLPGVRGVLRRHRPPRRRRLLYFVGRRDEMMKTSGYRVSPTEVEEVLYATGLVGEVAFFGVTPERHAGPVDPGHRHAAARGRT